MPTDEEAGSEVSEEVVEKDNEPTEEPELAQEKYEEPPQDNEASEAQEGDSDEVPPNRLYRFAKKLMDRRELAEDTKDLMVAFLSTSDRAKTEMVRMTAREVRNYLEELRLKEELVNLVRSHSLEVNASFSLKPIEGMLQDDVPEEGEE